METILSPVSENVSGFLGVELSFYILWKCEMERIQMHLETRLVRKKKKKKYT
jgi:hypothetical protein